MGLCRWEIQKRGSCKFGAGCIHSHDLSKFSPAQIQQQSSSTYSPSPSYANPQSSRGAATSGRGRGAPRGGRGGLTGSRIEAELPVLTLKKQIDYKDANSIVNFRLSSGNTFTRTKDVYLFLLALLSSASAEWTEEEERQAIFAAIARIPGEGPKRVQDILSWPKVSTSAGNSVDTLSFQRGICALLWYMSSKAIVGSTVAFQINALYSAVHGKPEVLCQTITSCLEQIIKNDTVADRSLPEASKTNAAFLPKGGIEIYSPTIDTFTEYLNRYKDATLKHACIEPCIKSVADTFEAWSFGVLAGTVTDELLDQSEMHQNWAINEMRKRLARLLKLSRIPHRIVESCNEAAQDAAAAKAKQDAKIIQLTHNYSPPGELRPAGPRHDNDHANIANISIIPTHEELVSTLQPYLPSNVLGAPHHLEPGSMARQLDVHFRLLREDLISPLRQIACVMLEHLSARVGDRQHDQIKAIIHGRGGRVKSLFGSDGVDFNVYTDILPVNMEFIDDTAVHLNFAIPPGEGRSGNAHTRRRYWDTVTKKSRLVSGSLVCLVWMGRRNEGPSFYIGTITSRPEDLAHSKQDFGIVKVSFFDKAILARVRESLEAKRDDVRHLLFETSGMIYATIGPFLERLQEAVSAMLPFSRYLAESNAATLIDLKIDPPAFAARPGFAYELNCLLKDEEKEGRNVRLRPTDVDSVAGAARALKQWSFLDPSQVDCLMDVLTQEFSLVQGPPGTGKSFLGIQLVKVLLASKDCTPILCIAETNHALDIFLKGTAKVTKQLVRLGSRSSDEEISAYNLEAVIESAGDRQNFARRRDYAKAKEAKEKAQDELNQTMARLRSRQITGNEFLGYLRIHEEDLHHSFLNPPPYIKDAYQFAQSHGEWQTVGGRPKPKLEAGKLESMLNWWQTGGDFLVFAEIEDMKTSQMRDLDDHESLAKAASDSRLETSSTDSDASDASSDMEDLFSSEFGPELSSEVSLVNTDAGKRTAEGMPDNKFVFDNHLEEDERAASAIADAATLSIFPPKYQIPTSSRTFETLQELSDVWSFSNLEREALFTKVQAVVLARSAGQLTGMHDKFKAANAQLKEIRDQSRVEVLQRTLVIGCTTNGAAKYSALLKAAGIKVLIVEEAGQVLEAHVLASLSPSIELMTSIGDPLQLRPSIASYNLSMDSKQGASFALDMSHMERLSGPAEFPMRSLQTQRRMRPEVSCLVKQLYPNLQDHPTRLDLPKLRGLDLPTSTFFLAHSHGEQVDGVSSSKSNRYEAQMVRDLVLHFIRHGYNQPGDIAVITGYLAQLFEIRKLLAGQVAVVVDERDDLGELGVGLEVEVRQVKIDSQVLIRTVDNFQGEEAKIIILSLVRNAGSDVLDALGTMALPGRNRSIGFLKSPNRTNVALSRAQEGMVILGDAVAMRQSPMWTKVLDIMEETGSVGSALPFKCARHPSYTAVISEPGQLLQISPDGGCLESCGFRLNCGHLCPFKCHPTDNDASHRLTQCNEPCASLLKCGHPCEKDCCEDCDENACSFLFKEVQLPCGHTQKNVTCGQTKNLGAIRCMRSVEKELPTCEHSLAMLCYESPAMKTCKQVCGLPRNCCSQTCRDTCGACQRLNPNVYETDSEGDASDDDDEIRPAAALASASVKQKKKMRPIKTVRSVHQAHEHGKTLFCQHNCRTMCSQTHECRPCSNEVYSTCGHKAERATCSSVTSPCLSMCENRCEHTGACEVVCGMPCTRLPCEQKCSKPMTCGHECLSLCGETCICLECQTSDKLMDIVDLVMQETLAEVGRETPVIKLECGHIFTVETLDGILEMKDFYNFDKAEKIKSLVTSSPSDYIKMPGCPTCRRPLTKSLRYSRIVKRAFLDIQERNVLQQGATTLLGLKATLEQENKSDKFSIGIKALDVRGGDATEADQAKKVRKKLRPAVLHNLARASEVLADTGLPPKLLAFWKSASRALSQIHDRLVATLKIRPPHLAAWEAAFSGLVKNGRNAMLLAERPPQDPDMAVMRFARAALGAPRPLSDSRSKIEGFWLLLEVLFELVAMAEQVATSLRKVKHKSQDLWQLYRKYLAALCLKNAKYVFELSKEASSSKRIATSALWGMQVQYCVVALKTEGALTGSKALREGAADMVLQAKQDLEAEYEMSTAGNTVKLSEEQTAQRDQILELFDTLYKRLLAETFYEDVSDSEKIDVMRALLGKDVHSVSGHFYRCEQGHTFTIGECGMAMQLSSCPECGSPVGGGSHRMVEGVTRDTEMEQLAVRVGLR